MNKSLSAPSETIFIKNIATLDCAIFDPLLGVIGQSWYVDLDMAGPLDEHGFVYDFSKLKDLVKQVLKTTLDHTLLIPVGSQFVQYTEDGNTEQWRLHAKSKINQTDFEWIYKCPKGAVYPVRTIALRTSLIEQELGRLVRHRLSPNIQYLNISLRKETTPGQVTTFCYTHGIPNHEGLCQRLFHGHRCLVEIYQGPERRLDLETMIIEEYFGPYMHFATKSQILKGEINPNSRGTTNDPVVIGLNGSLGYYETSIPANRVFLVENEEASIENITRHVAVWLKQVKNINSPLRVVCYEGLGKGAIYQS